MFENVKEHLISVGKFNTPLTVSGKTAVSVIILRLILMPKGLIQSRPDMGIDIVGRYRYARSEDVLNRLEEEIKNQISTYVPTLTTLEINIDVKDRELLIGIKSPTDTYVFLTDFDNSTVLDLSEVKKPN